MGADTTTEMRSWLQENLSRFSLSEEVEEYLLGRGAKEESYRELEIKTWAASSSPAPCKDFRARYGDRGEKLRGCLVTPYHSPSGSLIGFEARRTTQKWITDYRLMPECKWLPVWLGTRRAIPKLWDGGEVWIVEGLFDLFAMEWVIPSTDAILASVRAALSYSHVQFLRRLSTKYVHMVYDEDSTGRDGNEKAIFSLDRVGVPGGVVRYCGGKDPGEIWDRGGEEGLLLSFSNMR